MSEEEIINKWFEKNMCVSFKKFTENWEEQQELTHYLQQENTQLKENNVSMQEEMYKYWKKAYKLQQENSQLKEDIKFCLHSIKQEMKMSTDSRTRKEMKTCYDILERWNI